MPDTSVNLIEPNDKEFDSIKKIASSLDIAPVENEFVILDQAHNVRMELPYTLYRVLVDAAQQLAKGNTVGVLHYEQAVTTQQAAEILQVSRPYVVKLLEEGEIPFYMVGSHRRISLKDVLDYKTRRDAHRKSKLVELYQASNDAGLYDIDNFPQDDEDAE
ncbi:helix-turn-helix domain-containing protein [Alicyclobacillus fodiniaquatilis]|uniref:Helix-turn-helix domain-containing protein n=1 Tax=Alicyclobacillus fodiniaquatilis TaxID=1661150 RepID=A0ABW4JD63_9BACL